MKKLQSLLFSTLFTICLVAMAATTTEAQTNRLGSYIYKTAQDGSGATIKLYVYDYEGETYGRMRVENSGGAAWEFNLWTLKNGDYMDFYYEMDPDDIVFDIQDTHILTMSGDAQKPLAVFGKEFKAKIGNIKPADLITREGDNPTFKIKDRAKSQTVEIKKNK